MHIPRRSLAALAAALFTGLAALPVHAQKVIEALAALSPNAKTGIINCDSSTELGLISPATAPNVLARYATIRPAQSLTISANASTRVFYAIKGSGRSESDGGPIDWSEGDVFVLAGRQDVRLSATGTMNAVLWVVGDDPLMAFLNLTTTSNSGAVPWSVHYPAEDIERQLALIYSTDQEVDTAGRAVMFSSKEYDAIRNIAPVLTLALNTLEPGQQTRPHRHNSVAVMLVLDGENCHSMAGDKVKPWIQHSTTVTPPFAWHTTTMMVTSSPSYSSFKMAGSTPTQESMGSALAKGARPSS